MTKPALPASQIREAVEARLGPISDFEPLAERLESQVFAFRRDVEALVVVGPQRSGYDKGTFVARTFARPGSPSRSRRHRTAARWPDFLHLAPRVRA